MTRPPLPERCCIVCGITSLHAAKNNTDPAWSAAVRLRFRHISSLFTSDDLTDFRLLEDLFVG